MPIRKNARVYLMVEPHIKKELEKESKKSKKYITELLLEGWELYKNNKYPMYQMDNHGNVTKL